MTMTRLRMAFVVMMCWAWCLAGTAQVKMAAQGTATQLSVGGKPMLLLGGELSNSAATSVDDIDEVMPRMKALGLNTVLVPVCWDLLEPVEGQFDFTLTDRTIDQARQCGLKVVLLWFGAWKNSMSCYAPLWFKEDTKRFPRSMTRTGKPLEIASAFSANVLQADKRAFLQLMRHLAEKDGQENTVLMVQVENEIGMLEDARDHSAVADKMFAGAVPSELIAFLQRNKKQLHPWLSERLGDGKQVAKGNTWQQVFGSDLFADEIFMAYHYARYVEQLASEARAIYDLPLYVNAAMNSRGRKPGEYPSAGPLAHLIDIWHCGAPSIDLLAPDLYDTGFKGWVAQYKLHNNPLFIPECRLNDEAAAKALYVYGEYDAIGFCPFCIDKTEKAYTDQLSKAYDLLHQLESVLLKHQGQGHTYGLLFDKEDQRRVVNDGDVVLTCSHTCTLGWDGRYRNADQWPTTGGIVVRLSEKEYLIAGTGIVVAFAKATEAAQQQQRQLGEDGFAEKGDNDKADEARFKGKRIGIGFVDEVKVDANGKFSYVRRDNGDQDHQGRHARIDMDCWRILHVKLYEY